MATPRLFRLLGLGLLLCCLLLLGWRLTTVSVPRWRAQALVVADLARTAGTDPQQWADVQAAARDLPWFPPFRQLRQGASAMSQLTAAAQSLQGLTTLPLAADGQTIPRSTLDAGLTHLHTITHQLQSLSQLADSVPTWALDRATDRDPAQLSALRGDFRQTATALTHLREVLHTFLRQPHRVLILLQNHNEVRPSGGFSGSVLILDFDQDGLSYQFRDIYSLDRLVPDSARLPVPDYFTPLDQTLSLRDANFSPHFPTVADTYRHFFRAIDQPEPDTVLAVNLSLLTQLIRLTGPVSLPPYDIQLTELNADLILSFLVESKAAGRYSAKDPVLALITQLITQLKEIDDLPAAWAATGFDPAEYIAQKNFLAHSQNTKLQQRWAHWGLSGELRHRPTADNALYVDLVSIGANKSDRFMWTRLHHDSEIKRDGRVRNLLQITRTHALRDRELDQLLGVADWPPTLQALADTQGDWVLGLGQNRVVMRVHVPAGAQLISGSSPSGPITSSLTPDALWTVWEVPLFMKPGENIDLTLEYETPLQRGSSDWRPYHLQVIGTPIGRQLTYLPTISADAQSATVQAQSQNLGLPQPMVDNDYRIIVEYKPNSAP